MALRKPDLAGERARLHTEAAGDAARTPLFRHPPGDVIGTKTMNGMYSFFNDRAYAFSISFLSFPYHTESATPPTTEPPSPPPQTHAPNRSTHSAGHGRRLHRTVSSGGFGWSAQCFAGTSLPFLRFTHTTRVVCVPAEAKGAALSLSEGRAAVCLPVCLGRVYGRLTLHGVVSHAVCIDEHMYMCGCAIYVSIYVVWKYKHIHRAKNTIQNIDFK